MRRTVVSAVMMLALMVPAAAAEVDFATVLRDADGKNIQDCEKFEDAAPGVVPKCERFVELTLGRVARAVLSAPEPNLALDEQVRRGLLARSIAQQSKQNLSAEDVKMLKDLIAKRGFSPVVVIDAIELLDPASLKK